MRVQRLRVRPLPCINAVFVNEENVADFLHTHVAIDIGSRVRDGPINKTVELVQEGDVTVHHVDHVRGEAVISSHDLLNVLILRGIATRDGVPAGLPAADLKNTEPEIDKPEQVENDETNVLEEVCLSAVGKDDKAIDVNPDHVAEVHDVLRAKHALGVRGGEGCDLHEEDAFDDDGDDDETNPQHRAGLDGSRGNGA